MLELKDSLLAKDELKAGKSIQEALMPERNPEVPDWDIWLFTKPANDVGGDLVDFQKLGENRYSAAIGDVAGKGLGAALMMAKLQATLRALAPNFSSLPELGQKINDILHRDRVPKSFASLVYFEFSSSNNKIKIFNAGHMPPVILRKTDVEEMPKGDVALGLMPGTNYVESVLELNKNDSLIVYSDGLTEAQNEYEGFFGQKKLLGILPNLYELSASKIGDHILSEVKQFVGNAPVHDDLSLVIIKRK
jgi:sigma-B regulation protein RsbU (phosphoserine phosphatase)